MNWDIPADLIAEEQSVPFVTGAERNVAVTGGGYWPTLLKMPDGELAAVLRGGSPHVGLNSRLDLIRSADSGRTWSPPETIVPQTSGIDIRGAAAGVMADGSMVVSYWECTCYREAKYDPSVGTNLPHYIISADNGRTWSAKRALQCDMFPKYFVPYGRICVLPEGTALMPVYGPATADNAADSSAVLRSDDNGQSWGNATLIAANTNETSVIHMPDNRLLAFLRTENADFSRDGTVVLSQSHGLGRTWSEPIQLTRPHQHPADACLLASGNLLMTYGNRLGELAVGAMISRDGGRTWDREGRVVLAAETMTLRGKQFGDCGYPSTVQLDDGTIVTLYYRLGHAGLPPEEIERCRQYERDVFMNPPASEDMRRFEEAVCIRYTEDQLG